MISFIIYILVIISPAVMISVYTGKKLECTLPVSCGILIAFLFPFGLAGWLHVGVIVEGITAAGLLIWSVCYIRKKGIWKKAAAGIFTSGMIWFLISLAILTVGIHGKLFDQWDEFSHWGDVVKATFDLNGFSTNPESLSAFQTYPPGMVIFQYLFQKIHVIVGGLFSEWRAYASYNLFLLCFMAPVFSGLSLKKMLFSVPAVISILLFPTIFFQKTYFSLYVDAAVSIVFAYGLYSITANKEHDRFQTISICTACLLLPLLKDVGMLLSFVLLAVFFFTYRKIARKTELIAAALSFAVPIVLWKLNVKISNATEVFPLKYDIGAMFRIFGGGGEVYQQTVLEEYPKALITKIFPIGNTGFGINYLTLMVLIAVLLFFTLRHFAEKTEDRKYRVIRIAVPLFLLVYTFGLHISYMFQFAEYEATRLSAFERYMGIPLCGAGCYLLYCWIDILEQKETRYTGILLCITLLAAPLENTYSFLTGKYILSSVEARSKYSEMDSKIRKNIQGQEPATIYIISQQDNGGALWVMHYLCRPNRVLTGQLTGFSGYQAGGYSIGQPYHGGDVWSVDITPEELMRQWVERYNYVLVVHTNDYLNETFSRLFDSEISDGSLFRIDRENEIARRVE